MLDQFPRISFPFLHAVAFCSLLGLLASCSSMSGSASFDPTTSRYVFDKGENTIVGEAVVVTSFGVKRTCAHSGVSLVPVTSYSTAWMERTFGEAMSGYTPISDLDVFPHDEEFFDYSRRADCDESGNFRLEHVADGKYYVLSQVVWTARWGRNGGDLMEPVEVGNGDSKVVSMGEDLSKKVR
jgi:hypothetical protein